MSTISRAVLVLFPSLVPASLRPVERRKAARVQRRARALSEMSWRAEAAENTWCPRIRWP